MNILKAQIREASSKGNQLRREGIVPAVLFGKHLEESISIQIPKGDVVQFLHNNPIGSKVDLTVGKKKYMALFKNVDYIPAVNLIQHLSFQVMTAGEKVTSEFHIHLHNRAKVEGIVQQHLSQVHYKALPDKLFDTVDVELEGKVVGDSAVLADLDFATNPDIEILTPLDSPVYSIAPHKVIVEDAPAPAVSAEVPAFEAKEET